MYLEKLLMLGYFFRRNKLLKNSSDQYCSIDQKNTFIFKVWKLGKDPIGKISGKRRQNCSTRKVQTGFRKWGKRGSNDDVK
jgi:hypothetical protein